MLIHGRYFKNRLLANNRGFSLIELIVIIVIIGILATMLMPRWTSSSLGLEYEANRLLDTIRYAQSMSITSGQRYRWVRLSANSYQVTNQSGTAVVLPNGSTTVTLSQNFTFGTLTNLPNNLIAFDSQGTPYTTSTTPGTALASTAIIPITSGSSTRSIAITPQTGYGALQ